VTAGHEIYIIEEPVRKSTMSPVSVPGGVRSVTTAIPVVKSVSWSKPLTVHPDSRLYSAPKVTPAVAQPSSPYNSAGSSYLGAYLKK
jgi:hypothetical protein